MLTEFTTPGPALTVDDDATIYSLLTTRLETSTRHLHRTRRPTVRGAP